MNDTVLWGVASGVIKSKTELPRGAISEPTECQTH